jgi:hypothetical protein
LSGDRGLPSTSGGQPPLVRKSLLIPVCLVLAGCSGQAVISPIGTQQSVGVNARHTAELDVVSGVSSVLVRSANLGAALYRAQDPAQVEVQGDVVRVSVRSAEPGNVVIDLNSVVEWRIALDGAATEEHVDLSGGRLSELDLGAGAGRTPRGNRHALLAAAAFTKRNRPGSSPSCVLSRPSPTGLPLSTPSHQMSRTVPVV